jgi:transcription elongation GreA/GreB family factor
MAENEALDGRFEECAEKGDIDGALALLRGNPEYFEKKLAAKDIGEALKKATSDRLVLSYIDFAAFGARPLPKSLDTLGVLMRIVPGRLVLAKVWGLGEVKRIDHFHNRITVDFKTKRGHQYAYEVAVDSLSFPGDDHILVVQRTDPARVEAMLKDHPGEFVKAVLASHGEMPLVKLEKIAVENGFVKQTAWRSFWERARAELKQNKWADIPEKKMDHIVLRKSAEEYGDGWLTAFSHETEPARILAGAREFAAAGKFKSAGEDVREKIAGRLVFAITAARKTDDALYARLANLIVELGLSRPPAEEMLEYLWARHRYIKAAAALPAREVGALVRFLARDEASREKLYAALPEFCFAAVSEIVSQFSAEAKCREAVAALMKTPKAPATLVTLLVGKYEQFRDWKELPPLVVLLTHAIVLGEGRQGGETLRMQNMVRRLFADVKWLGKMFDFLSANEKAMIFERFQASIAWDPSTHHAIVVRMTKLVPELEAHLVKAERKRDVARTTSFRSYAMKKAEYLKLINKDMPENVRRIEFAKGFGDLSENAEYQYAKDEQRQLMQKQAVMQADLEAVKPSEFADAPLDEVGPGVMVVVSTAAGEKTFTILGEWDNDPERGILSSKTKVAGNMLGKKVSESFMLPAADGSESEATIVGIKPLSAEIREWMKTPEGMNI